MTTRSRSRVIDAIAALEGPDGEVTPEEVVDAARDPASPLHRYFQWDVEAAAYEHWLDTARGLIRSVEVELVVRRRTINVVQYVHDVRRDSKPRSAGYVNIENVTPAGLAQATLDAELGRIESVVQRALGIAARLGMEDECRSRLRAMLR